MSRFSFSTLGIISLAFAGLSLQLREKEAPVSPVKAPETISAPSAVAPAEPMPALTPAQLAQIGTPECSKAYRAYMSASAGRSFQILGATAEKITSTSPTNTPEQIAQAEEKYHSVLRNAGIGKLTEAAGNVGAICGATPVRVLNSGALKLA